VVDPIIVPARVRGCGDGPTGIRRADTAAERQQQVNFWLSLQNLVVLSDNEDHWECLNDAMRCAKTVGKDVHGAHTAALCITHGVEELWTADKDFRAFPGLVVRNPLVDEVSVGRPPLRQS
jgi:predicted nucleic acid-binding protein